MACRRRCTARSRIEDGAVGESNFHDYRLLRLADSPAIDVHIVPSEAEPSGVGEPGVPPIAPAVANAVFAATGVAPAHPAAASAGRIAT